jgi:hypothetical protein
MDGGTMGEGQSGCPVGLFAEPIRVIARAGLRALNNRGGVVASRLGPLGRAAGFYVHAWQRWLSPDRSHAGDRVPFPSLPLALGALADESLLSLARVVRRPLVSEEYDRIGAEVSQAIDLYRQRGWLDEPASFFSTPPPAEPQIHRTHLLGGLSFERFEFDSGYSPDPDDPGRARWLAYEANRTAHAWVLRHRTPRPWLVGLHGAGMGYPRADLFAFQAAWLHHVLGLNLAFPTMPLHGRRRRGVLPSVGFPSDDLLETVHGVAQAVWDTRRLVGWIRLHEDQEVGIFGLSLGGYAAAVIAGTESPLSCVIAGVPAVDFVELFERHAPTGFRRLPEFVELAAAARIVHRVVSPLALPPQVALDRRFIFAGLADRLIHPRYQVRALWEHWQQPSIHWFEGSHIGFLWSGTVREFVQRSLTASGMAKPEAA